MDEVASHDAGAHRPAVRVVHRSVGRAAHHWEAPAARRQEALAVHLRVGRDWTYRLVPQRSYRAQQGSLQSLYSGSR